MVQMVSLEGIFGSIPFMAQIYGFVELVRIKQESCITYGTATSRIVIHLN